MPSLGERLKQQNIDRQERTQALIRATNMEQQRQLERDAAKINQFCDEVKTLTKESIRLDVMLMPFRVPNKSPFNTYSWDNSRSEPEPFKKSAHAPIYRGLVEWGKSNDLSIQFIYSHDGMGMESWFDVTVNPL